MAKGGDKKEEDVKKADRRSYDRIQKEKKEAKNDQEL